MRRVSMLGGSGGGVSFCAPLHLLCTVEALLRIIFDDSDKDKLGGWRQHFFFEVGRKKEMQRRDVTNDTCAREREVKRDCARLHTTADKRSGTEQQEETVKIRCETLFKKRR